MSAHHPTLPVAPHSSLTPESRGMLLGLLGVAIFSLTIPLTRMAVQELDATFVALGRALVAALLAAIYLRCTRATLPPLAALLPLSGVGIGCVIGFPWLTSIALRSLPASHGAVMAGILPLATAVYSSLRGSEKPSLGFWLMALLGSALVIGFALRQSGGSFHAADLLMFAALLLGAIGYAEGGRLARTMGGDQVIGWALLLSAPVAAALLLWRGAPALAQLASAGTGAWLAFAYVSVFSMFIGFVFWYRGMALGGVARVGQVQLVQPFLSLAGAALLLGDRLTIDNVVFAVAVIVVVAVGRTMQIRR